MRLSSVVTLLSYDGTKLLCEKWKILFDTSGVAIWKFWLTQAYNSVLVAASRYDYNWVTFSNDVNRDKRILSHFFVMKFKYERINLLIMIKFPMVNHQYREWCTGVIQRRITCLYVCIRRCDHLWSATLCMSRECSRWWSAIVWTSNKVKTKIFPIAQLWQNSHGT